jgi:hypothetical protein
MSFKELVNVQLIVLLIVVAGLAYYALKRTGYIEGLETKESNALPAGVEKTTGTKKVTIM